MASVLHTGVATMATTYSILRGLIGSSLSLLLAGALGCGVEGGPIDEGGGDGDDGDDTIEPGEQTDPPDDPGDGASAIDPTGTYRIDSQFDIVGGMPGAAGDVLNTFIDMTDDPYDPATWVLDRVAEGIDSDVIGGLLDAARPSLDETLYDLLRDSSPGAIDDFMALADAFREASQRFGTWSRLEVVADGTALAATHTMTGYRFVIDGDEHLFVLADLGSEPIAIEGVPFTYDGSGVTLAEHGVPLQYGGFLGLALEDVIIPMIDPDAADLEELLTGIIDCEDVGVALAERIGLGSADFYQGACELGLSSGSDAVMDQLVSLDQSARVELVISGAAQALDQNGDGAVDTLSSGRWNGAVDYAGSRGNLAPDVSTFTGERM